MLIHFTRYCILALVIFAPLARGGVKPWAVTSIHIITLMALTAYLIDRTIQWRWKWEKTPLDWPILASVFLVILSTIFSIHRPTSIKATTLYLNYIVVFYLGIRSVRSRDDIKQIIYTIIGMGVFLSIFGIIKQVGFNPFPFWEYPDTNYGQRLTSTYGCPNHMAGFLEIAIPLSLAMMLASRQSEMKSVMLFCLAIMFAALILTLSRGAWIAVSTQMLVFAILLLTTKKVRMKNLALTCLLVIIPLFFLTFSNTFVVDRLMTLEGDYKETSLGTRIEAWGGGLKMIKENPWLGHGPGVFKSAFPSYQPANVQVRLHNAHNDFIQMAATQGLIAWILFAWIIALLVKKWIATLHSRMKLRRLITIALLSISTGLLIHSMVDFNFQIPANVIVVIMCVVTSISFFRIHYYKG